MPRMEQAGRFSMESNLQSQEVDRLVAWTFEKRNTSMEERTSRNLREFLTDERYVSLQKSVARSVMIIIVSISNAQMVHVDISETLFFFSFKKLYSTLDCLSWETYTYMQWNQNIPHLLKPAYPENLVFL